jgi:prephenate dehydrogenase
MKIFIVGLGLMGSSYAEKLHDVGHDVFGYDIQKDAILKGREEGYIAFDSDLSKLMTSDLIILALYANDNIEFIRTHQHLFKSNALLTDISGVKHTVVNQIEAILRPDVDFVSHHPMAGRAKKGFQSKDKTMFIQSNAILIQTKRGKEYNYALLSNLLIDLGFKRVITMTPEAHDQAIAYTSQLTHAIASSLMNGLDEVTVGTTGDSFKELTRIANINETLWTNLFLENKELLVDAMESFQAQLEQLKQAIIHNDEKNIQDILKKGRIKRESFEKNT